MKQFKLTRKKIYTSLMIASMFALTISALAIRSNIKTKAAYNNQLVSYINKSTANIPEYKITEATKYKQYFGQLHAHTNLSDGLGTCEEAYKYVTTKAHHVSFFALTEHSCMLDNHKQASLKDGSMSKEWLLGKRMAKKYSSDKVVCMFGYEMSYLNGLGHLNTYNTPGFISRLNPAYSSYDTGLQSYYKALITQPKSVTQFNHPGKRWGTFKEFDYYSVKTDSVVGTLEMPGYHKTNNMNVYCYYYNVALSKGWHISPSNNQDNHKKNWVTENPRRSVIMSKNSKLTEDEIYDAMRNNRTYSTEDYDFYLRYTLDNYLMGSKLNITSIDDNIELKIGMYDATDNIGTVQVVVNNGKIIKSEKVDSKKATLTYKIPATYSYYYVRIKQDDGDTIVSAPVWLGYYRTSGGTTIPNVSYIPTTVPTTVPTTIPTTIATMVPTTIPNPSPVGPSAMPGPTPGAPSGSEVPTTTAPAYLTTYIPTVIPTTIATTVPTHVATTVPTIVPDADEGVSSTVKPPVVSATPEPSEEPKQTEEPTIPIEIRLTTLAPKFTYAPNEKQPVDIDYGNEKGNAGESVSINSSEIDEVPETSDENNNFFLLSVMFVSLVLAGFSIRQLILLNKKAE